MEAVTRRTAGLDRKRRADRAIIPAELTAGLKNDAELFLAYLTARYPAFAKTVTSLTGEGGDTSRSLETGLPRVIEAVNVTPWAELLQGALESQLEGTADYLEDAVSTNDRQEGLSNGQTRLAPLQLLLSEVPFRQAARTPAKVTVTELQRLGLERQPGLRGEDPEQEAVWEIFGNPVAVSLEKADMPLTLRSKRETGRDGGAPLGTAMHLVFQFLDLRTLRGQPMVKAEKIYASQLDRMVEALTLTEEARDAALTFTDQAVRWANSELAGRLLRVEETSGKVYREIPFTLALPSSHLDASFPADETSLIQGMIDLWFVEEDGAAILIDFKTDHLTGDRNDGWLRERYGVQIKFYAEAIARATGRKVKEKLIWLIREARAVAFP
jgi:ATP-dependent helicase/nuclease subunit A